MTFLLILLLLHLSAIADGAVAPGDEDKNCLRDLRRMTFAPIPAYSDNMRVLMDSWNYQNLLPPRTGAVWDQVDNDVNNPSGIITNWTQNFNNPCQQRVSVCGFTAGPQDNWLITQLINRTVNGMRLPQVSVIIEFEMPGCDGTLNCQQTFNTHIYETSSVNATAARNTSNYHQVRRVSPNDMSGARVNETIVVNFNTNNPSFYFVIQDETTCIVVTRLLVFYHICRKQTVDLIHHPEIIAPVLGQSTEVLAKCVMNAKPVSDSAPLALICSAGGVWSQTPPSAGCRCVAGHLQSNETCDPCPAGTYLSPSSNSCSTCPANSVSEEEGATQCTCVEGYYRATQGEEDLPCDLLPSSPRNLRVVDRTENSITVTWEVPEQTGTRTLTYSVYTSANGGPRVKIDAVNETRALISDLLPGQSYTVYISAQNSITNQLQENLTATITASIYVSTLENLPANIPLAAVVIPPIFVLTMLIIISTVAILIMIIRRKVKNATTEEVYSVVGPPPLPVRINRNMSYEQRTELHGLQTITNITAATNRSSQGLDDEVTETRSDINPILGLNPAYGTNIAMAPEIETERNEAYSSNICSVRPESGDSQSCNRQRAPDHFDMAANSAYGTNVAIAPDIDTQRHLAYEHII